LPVGLLYESLANLYDRHCAHIELNLTESSRRAFNDYMEGVDQFRWPEFMPEPELEPEGEPESEPHSQPFPEPGGRKLEPERDRQLANCTDWDVKNG